jgi:hypothetical protein
LNRGDRSGGPTTNDQHVDAGFEHAHSLTTRSARPRGARESR